MSQKQKRVINIKTIQIIITVLMSIMMTYPIIIMLAIAAITMMTVLKSQYSYYDNEDH